MSTTNHKNIFQQFGLFLKTFGVIGLAIALVIGNASSILVQALVADLINPFIGLFLPSGSLQTLSFSVHGVGTKASEFKYGDMISMTINFMIIAFVVFLAYRTLSKMKLVDDKTQIKNSLGVEENKRNIEDHQPEKGEEGEDVD